jgi:peroxiredoxin
MVYGISRDSPWSHAAWAEVLGLDFPLLSDWNGDATRGFGIARDFNGFADVPERTAFVVDREGVVRGAWRYDDGEVPDFDLLLAAAANVDR